MDTFDGDDDYEAFDDDGDDVQDDVGEDDLDFAVAAYREEGVPVVAELSVEAANDLDELIGNLRRLPSEVGAVGLLSLTDDVFAAVRVRGQKVQVLLSDAYFVEEWPLARDIAEYLGVDVDIDIDDEPELLGDLDIFADVGISELDIEALVEAIELSSDQVLALADRIGFGAAVRRVVDDQF